MTAFIFYGSSCIFLHFVLQLLYQLTNVRNKIQFMTCIKLIHVSAPGCHPQGVFLNKGYRLDTLIWLLPYLHSYEFYLISTLVGWCINFRNMQGMSKTNFFCTPHLYKVWFFYLYSLVYPFWRSFTHVISILSSLSEFCCNPFLFLSKYRCH